MRNNLQWIIRRRSKRSIMHYKVDCDIGMRDHVFIDFQKHWLEEDICAGVPEGEQCLLKLKLLDPQD